MRKWLTYTSFLFNVLLAGAFFFLIHQLGGWRYMLYKVQHRGAAGIYEHRKNLFELLPSDSNTIVMLGNSLTAQCEWAEWLGDPSIRNRGIPGDMTTGLLERLPEVFRLHPRKIFLMIGINDLLFRTPQEVLGHYEKIVQTIRSGAPQAQLYLQSLLPVNNEVRNTMIRNEHIRQLNEGIRNIAAREKLIFIDLYPLLLDGEGRLDEKYTDDGIHVNGLAYRVWRDAIRGYVTD